SLIGGTISISSPALLVAALRSCLRFCAQFALGLFRLPLFIHLQHRNKRVPSTRRFVFVVSLQEVLALDSLQPLLFWCDSSSFSRERGVSWGVTFVLMLPFTLLQLGYILQLNRSRGRLADDRLLLDVLDETQQTKRWRYVWTRLVCVCVCVCEGGSQ
ncbi:hypothetical protein BBJ28_00026021, partial [Nothophytophthora sp. Chile5]